MAKREQCGQTVNLNGFLCSCTRTKGHDGDHWENMPLRDGRRGVTRWTQEQGKAWSADLTPTTGKRNEAGENGWLLGG